VLSVIAAIGRWLPRGWADLFRQFALYFFANLLYETSRGLADGRAIVAITNGERVIDLEHRTGLFFEPSVQSLILPYTWLIDLANTVYLNSQFTVAMGFLIWLYLFRNDAYYFVRNMFIVSMALALVGYIGFPTAPPRMFPEYGFVDTVNAHSSVNHDSAFAKLLINPFAAVPSMHCAFSLMIGATGFMVCRNRFARAFWACWPLLVASVVVVTANHYWIDAALGWTVAGLSCLIAAQVIAQFRPDEWSLDQLLSYRERHRDGGTGSGGAGSGGEKNETGSAKVATAEVNS